MQRNAAIIWLPIALGACGTLQPTGKAAVDYNKAFAKSRDEVTVINILRASERQPLQFSTISSVQGGLRTGATLKLPFTNIIAGGEDSISPEVSFSSRNPTVSITPLATKEFVLGISRPLSPSTIDLLLSQGWSRQVVLSLTIGGVVCQNGDVVLNGGNDEKEDELFLEALEQATAFDIQPGAEKPYARLRMSGKDALSLTKDGVGEGKYVKSITSVSATDVMVEVAAKGDVEITGVHLERACSEKPAPPRPTTKKVLGQVQAGPTGIIMRSVFGIYQYLGEAHARNHRNQRKHCDGTTAAPATPRLFDLRLACSKSAPPDSVVSTSFQGSRFYVSPAGRVAEGDRTLETLSLLTFLVDLQTNEAAVKLSVPFVAIAQ